MFRTMALSGVAALGLLFASAETQSAEAADLRINLGIGGGKGGIAIGIGGRGHDFNRHGRFNRFDHDRHYEVVYRTCSHDRWRVYGVYHSHGRAHDIVDALECRGYQARVIHGR